MRISDWSSDGCSSDLIAPSRVVVLADRKVFITPMESGLRMAGTVEFGGLQQAPNLRRAMLLARHVQAGLSHLRIATRKSDLEGKSVVVRVDIGGGRRVKKKRENTNRKQQK